MQNYVRHESIEGAVVDERKSLNVKLGCIYSSGIFVQCIDEMSALIEF
jgi:hypothetical protein